MLQFILHPDRAAWAALHAASPQATVYTAAWWLDAVTGSRWGAVADVAPDGTYRAALPMPLRRRWRGLGPLEVFQPFFTQQLGVLARPDYAPVDAPADAPPDTAPFLAALPAGLRAYGQLHVANKLAEPPPGFQTSERLTYHLDLTPAYPVLAAGFHQNHRRNLKKAAEMQLTAENADIAPAIIALFRRTKSVALPEFKPRHYALLARLATGLAAREQLLTLTARDGTTGALLAGGLFATAGRQVIYLLGATTETGRRQGAAHAVLAAVIRREAGSGRQLDFEGSMVPSVARFYAGFGAHPVPYLTFERP